jgi:hypothetical protein
MVSSYTANLAVFLTRETPIPHFNDVFELVKNAETKGIKWGAKKDGSTVNFFKVIRGTRQEVVLTVCFRLREIDSRSMDKSTIT